MIPDSGSQSVSTTAEPSIGIGLTLVMAAACGVTVANIYYCQPILGLMAISFPSSGTSTAFVPMATQLGYAAGLLLLVPLGDRIERRRLILMHLVALALCLAGAALAPSATSLLVVSALVGVASSVTQQLLPFAAELARPERRGATIGTVMSGLLCGILFSRVLSGAVGEHFGWRAVFWLGMLLTIATALALALILPKNLPNTRENYGELLKSMVKLWRDEPKLRQATLIQACVFGSFSALWTTLALHLDSHYQFDAQIAGLFGLIGAVGVLFAPMAGKIADTRGPYFVIGLATVTMSASWFLLGLWNSVPALILGIVALDFGAQSSQVSNQHVVQGLRNGVRNRLNAILVGGMFLGGAIGSAGSGVAWALKGWSAVCLLGLFLALLASGLHVRRHIKGSRENLAPHQDGEAF